MIEEDSSFNQIHPTYEIQKLATWLHPQIGKSSAYQSADALLHRAEVDHVAALHRLQDRGAVHKARLGQGPLLWGCVKCRG